MYVLPLSDTVRQHKLSIHSYGDDIQMYVAFDHRDPSSTSPAIWMFRNRLKMNDSKTEMIVFSSLRVKPSACIVAVGGESLQSAHQPRNLGVTLDVHLNMNAHIKRVFQVSYFQLKTI